MHRKVRQVERPDTQLQSDLDRLLHGKVVFRHPVTAPEGRPEDQRIDPTDPFGGHLRQRSRIGDVGCTPAPGRLHQQAQRPFGVSDRQPRIGNATQLDLVTHLEVLDRQAVFQKSVSAVQPAAGDRGHVSRDGLAPTHAHVEFQVAQTTGMVVVRMCQQQGLRAIDALTQQLLAQLGRGVDQRVRSTLDQQAAARAGQPWLCHGFLAGGASAEKGWHAAARPYPKKGQLCIHDATFETIAVLLV
jgi:hypothetical protein